ncbi:LOW QUALITY PROTEIN: kyphoscoliosis peptidase-like [Aplochiton taeniatus]
MGNIYSAPTRDNLHPYQCKRDISKSITISVIEVPAQPSRNTAGRLGKDETDKVEDKFKKRTTTTAIIHATRIPSDAEEKPTVTQRKWRADKANVERPSVLPSATTVFTNSMALQLLAETEKENRRPQGKRSLSEEDPGCSQRLAKRRTMKREETEEEKNVLRRRRIFSVQTITKVVTQGAHSELERLRAIWIFICHSIEYDVSGYMGLTEKVYSLERVLETGKGICSGYSTVCLKMCQEAGIECRKVSGHSRGGSNKLGQKTESDHSWNAVRLSGHWYLLDSCWGAGTTDTKTRLFMKKYNDFYFLTDPEEFIDSHYPDEQRWQLLDPPISLKEFNGRVEKSPYFYKMGLQLLQPKQLKLLTDDGEAFVSIKFSMATKFTYTISQQHHDDNRPVNSSAGFLTVTMDTMRLRLTPPARGTYVVDIFASQLDSDNVSLDYVCSFLLDCPRVKLTEELPENPSRVWGLQPNAGGCSHQAEAVVPDNTGSLRLDLQTSRPLTMVCKLTHKDLDPVTAKKCLATQISATQLTCHVLCPFRGCYMLAVYVKDHKESQESLEIVGNFLLRCSGNTVNLNQLFPADLSSSCGPGIKTAEAGLTNFSHTGALVSTQQGSCDITFQNTLHLEFLANLVKDQRTTPGYPLSRHVFSNSVGSKVTVSVALPEAGVYTLRLFAKLPNDQDFSHVCDFVLMNPSAHRSLPPFPSTYTSWNTGCVLLEPGSGLLEPCTPTRFRVKVPWAQTVSVVVAGQHTQLQLNTGQVWEGEADSGPEHTQLKLVASKGKNATSLSVLMYFDTP